MFLQVERAVLPENKAQPLTQEDLALRRELARQRHAERMSALAGELHITCEFYSRSLRCCSFKINLFYFFPLFILATESAGVGPDGCFPIPENPAPERKDTNEDSLSQSSKLPVDDDVFVAFARVFSGKIRVGQNLYVLGPKHNPSITLQKVSLSGG